MAFVGGAAVDAEQAAFLRAIAANPDDDTARLAFADFLDERTPGRGALVRLDLQLASLPKYDPERESLLNVRANLVARDFPLWRAELPAFPGVIYEPHFDRGLPAGVTAAWDALRACGDDLFAALPVRRMWLRLPERWPHLAALAAVGSGSWLGRVRELDGKPTNDALAALADCPALANLVALRLNTWTGLDYRGVGALAHSPHFGRLEELELSGHDIGNEEAELVADSRTLTRLTSYTSRGVGMSAASVVSSAVGWFAGAAVVRLRELRLPGHSCDPLDMHALSVGPATNGLEVLDVSDNYRVGDAGLGALLAPSSRLTGLRELNLQHTGLTDAGIRALADSPLVRNLHSLDVAENSFTDEGATALALSEYLPAECRVTVDGHPNFRRFTDLGLDALRERFPRLRVAEG